MYGKGRFPQGLPLALCLGLTGALVGAQGAEPTTSPAKNKAATPMAPMKTPPPAAAPAPPRPAPVKEPGAIEILKASCDKLAAARSLSFTALGAYEVPSLWGPPIIYGRIYEVTLKRPDKLRVITVADGPRTEFYDDGKVMMSFHPAENLVAVTEAPPTVDAALEKIYTVAGTYFPFTDVIVADPWKDLESGLTAAFWVGESELVGGTKTDVVAYEVDGVFIQMWIGRDDKLPRMARAMYDDDPMQLRHSVQFSNWDLNPVVADNEFTTSRAAGADRIAFSNPAVKSDLPAAVKPLGAGATRAPTPKPKPSPPPKPPERNIP
jgi:hypothetical protein